MNRPPLLGVVIPTLDEEAALPALLADLGGLGTPHRKVVADGGSRDRTREVAREAGARVVDAPRGRGRQMNAGARALDTPWLLFLHADTRIPAATLRAIERHLEDPMVRRPAFFRFRLDARGPGWRLLEWGQRVRERLIGLPYGDQGLIVSRERFEEVGGFPELPLFEDLEMARRLRASGGLDRIGAPLVVSARRYREEGPLLGWLRNALVITLYGAGVPPARLARLYPPRRGPTQPERERRRTLLVFAKDPVPGHVKTRLAASIGDEAAAGVYRRLGSEVADSIRGGNYRVRVAFDPPEAEAPIRSWLDPGDFEFVAQSGGGLGERLLGAFHEAFEQSDTVCVIGTDAPGVDREVVERAFAELERTGGAELVLGPALDGGYYLLGLARPADPLFHGIPWSTDRVLERTVERARREGLRIVLLEPLADVDRVEDLPEGWEGPGWPSRRGVAVAPGIPASSGTVLPPRDLPPEDLSAGYPDPLAP